MNAEAKPSITIQNVVASFSLTPIPLDLEKIHNAFRRESIWDEATFNYGVVVLRVEEPKMSFLIYQTGKVICTGAKSERDARRSDNYLIRRLRSAGFNVEKRTSAKIHNIVATADTSFEVDIEEFLHDISSEKGFKTIYEPEQFPAVIIKLTITRNDKATVLLFGTGKLVCVGLKDHQSIRVAIESIVSKLKPCSSS